MKFIQFNDRATVQKMVYAKDQVVRFTDDAMADSLIADNTGVEVNLEYGGWVDHEINSGRLIPSEPTE